MPSKPTAICNRAKPPESSCFFLRRVPRQKDAPSLSLRFVQRQGGDFKPADRANPRHLLLSDQPPSDPTSPPCIRKVRCCFPGSDRRSPILLRFHLRAQTAWGLHAW